MSDMNLLDMLNANRHLKWGDPNREDDPDDDAVVYLCAKAADEIITLRAKVGTLEVQLFEQESTNRKLAAKVAALEAERDEAVGLLRRAWDERAVWPLDRPIPDYNVMYASKDQSADIRAAIDAREEE